MMDRPFEARMAEIDVELRNLDQEMIALGTSLWALDRIDRITADARSKFDAVQARRQSLMADFAMLRADVRKAQ